MKQQPLQRPDVAALVADARAGQAQAFAALVSRFQGLVAAR